MAERAAVAVVGAGPAGIAAAVTAAERGLGVLLLDEGARPGGQVWRHRHRDELPTNAARWLARLDRCGVRYLPGTTVVDATPGAITAERDGRALRVEAAALVLATGARELFLPFPGWTLPGVTGVGGAQALLKAGSRVRGRRVVLAGSGPLLLPVAAALARAGARVALVAEQAEGARVRAFAAGLWRTPGRLLQAARYRATFARYRTGCWVVRAEGRGRVERVVLSDGRVEPCDLLAVGYGLVPATELARVLGCAVSAGRVQVDDEQRTTIPGVWCAGEPTGIGGEEAALTEGEIAGISLGGGVVPAPLLRAREAQRAFADRLAHAFAPRDELRAVPEADTLVCRCEDVPLGRLDARWTGRQGKLLTRAGMGPCQGRVCGPALDFLFGWEGDAVRPPVLPCALSTLIGESSEGAS